MANTPKHMNPDDVLIMTLPSGVPVYGPDSETAHRLLADINLALIEARLGYPLHSVRLHTGTSIVTFSGSECHDRALEPTAFAVKA